MKTILSKLRQKVVIGFVGGSDLSKQTEQLGEDCLNDFDYCFSENGLTAYESGKLICEESFLNHIGEKNYQRLVNFILHYIADIDIPKKRGTFIEFRNGMINVSPIGRNCSYAERLEFDKFDSEQKVREKLVEALRAKFADLDLQYSIGGQISIDVFPRGWDKTYCLNHVRELCFKEIHFFGDKTMKGGNDYEIYNHPEVIGHSVTDPQDTISQLKELFLTE